MLVIVLTSVMAYEIIAGFVVIGKYEAILVNAGIMLAYFFGLSFITGIFVILLVFGFCGDVHDTSKKSLKKIGKNIGMMGLSLSQAKRNTRMIKSLRVVKISFGGVNFIEKLTPVIFQHFTTARLIDCLLLSKSS